MAGGKETPRQKMIGMMYLVLTALLAMNISKDVLNAFIQINKGLGKTSEVLQTKAQATLAGLRNAKEADKFLMSQQPVRRYSWNTMVASSFSTTPERGSANCIS